MTETIELTYQDVVAYDEELATKNSLEHDFTGAEAAEDGKGADE